MGSTFSAIESGLGYLYQARHALLLVLSNREEMEISLERLDDVAFEQGGTPTELIQLKHHVTPASLTDSSIDLWKTLRIWSTQVKVGSIPVPGTLLTLITTAIAPEGSIAALLRPGLNRPADIVINRLSS